MFTSAILSMLISNVVGTSAAIVAACHTSFLLSAVTSTCRPREKGQIESDIPSNNYLRQEERLQDAGAQLIGAPELMGDVRKRLLQSDLLSRQREYAEHLQAMQFSVLEDAIYRLAPDASMRAGDKV